MYGNNSLYGGIMQPIGEYPRGEKLAPQVTGIISYGIVPRDVHSDRSFKIPSGNKIETYEGLSQLNISAGDLVFVPRKDKSNVTSSNPIYGDSAFSVFNGLLKKDSLLGYHKEFKAVGFALDNYPYAADALAPIGIDVQVKGITNFTNSSGWDIDAGEYLTWMPDTQEMRNLFKEDQTVRQPMRKMQRTHFTSIVKAAVVPLKRVVGELVKINKTDADKIREIIRPVKPLEITGGEEIVEGRDDISDKMKKLSRYLYEGEFSVIDAAIGWCPAPVKHDMIGQIVLM